MNEVDTALGRLRARAAELDVADPLAEHIDAFVRDGDVVSYLDGNSLGRPLESLPERFARFVQHDWGTRLIRSWDEQWMRRPFALGDRIGKLLGAAPGQTFIGDSTTVLLYKLIRAAVDAAAVDETSRIEIIIDDDAFPTDRFVVEGIARERGCSIRWLHVDRAAGATLEQVEAALGAQTALVVLSHVAYRSGFVADVARITAAAHAAGARILWDLCHSVGVIPTELDNWQVDLAAGCSYKYLNGGPGSPAFAYVRAEHQRRLTQPIQGWMGAADVFAMADRYEAAEGLSRFVSGTPPVLATVALEAMVELIEEVGVDAVHKKSVRLTTFAEEALEALVFPLGATLRSPRAGARRGSHLSIAHPQFRAITARLWERGVIPDFRAPDGLRIGLSPLSTTFAETLDGIEAIADEMRRARASERLPG